MDLLKELVQLAENEEKAFKRITAELDKETEDIIKFRKLEKQSEIQYKKLMESLHEAKKCLKSIIKLYDYI